MQTTENAAVGSVFGGTEGAAGSASPHIRQRGGEAGSQCPTWTAYRIVCLPEGWAIPALRKAAPSRSPGWFTSIGDQHPAVPAAVGSDPPEVAQV